MCNESIIYNYFCDILICLHFSSNIISSDKNNGEQRGWLATLSTHPWISACPTLDDIPRYGY